ncbi:MAG: dihydroorotase, partial [Taibaiella sp.]|nr:dihydroorotase [Taibaiella sp.]
PYHLALTDESLAGYSSMYKVSPPLRSEKDRQALVKGLNDGTIDCITSHHRPQEWDAKAKEFEYAAPGMNIQELAFHIVLQAMGDKAELDRITDAFSSRAREIFNLPSATVAKGNAAKLTIFTTRSNYTPTGLASLSKNNPFIGKELPGMIAGVISNDDYYINQ